MKKTLPRHSLLHSLILIGLFVLVALMRIPCYAEGSVNTDGVIWSANTSGPIKDNPAIETKDVTLTLQTEGEKMLIAQTGLKYAWPGVTFRGKWDLSEYEEVWAEVQNLDKELTITLYLRVDDSQSEKTQKWLTSNISLEPGQKATIMVALPKLIPAYIREKVYGMRGLPGNIQAETESGKAPPAASFNQKDTAAIWIYTSNVKRSSAIAVTKVWTATNKNQLFPWAKMTESEFFPMIDQFGQFRHGDWPRKTHTVADLQANIEQETKDLAAHPAPADWNEYGGWKNGPQQKATGHFRVEKYNGKWWLVDPTGCLFWSHGVDCVRAAEGYTGIEGREHLFEYLPQKDDPLAQFYGKGSSAAHGYYNGKSNYTIYNFTSANLLRKYGNDWRKIFGELAHKRIKSWGLNTVANWSEPDIYMLRKTPYTVNCLTGNNRIEGSSGFWGKFPDPFHPGFRRALQEGLQKHRDSFEDPWCIGVFVNNEIAWGNDTSLSEASFISPSEQPSKKAMLLWLQKKYTTIGELNAVWGTDYADWKSLEQVNTLPKGEGKKADMKAFYTLIAEEYFKVIHEEIKKVAPNKLDMGCRFAWSNELAIMAAVKYLDVVSFNEYTYSVEKFTLPQNADMPCIIGEFHFGALDRGMLHTGLKHASNQKDRASKYEQYVRGALKNKFWVGSHWFQFVSQPTTGRSDGENYQIGMLDVCDTPYPELIEAIRQVGRDMYQIRSNTD